MFRPILTTIFGICHDKVLQEIVKVLIHKIDTETDYLGTLFEAFLYDTAKFDEGDGRTGHRRLEQQYDGQKVRKKTL